jgi:hypothetical protein
LWAFVFLPLGFLSYGGKVAIIRQKLMLPGSPWALLYLVFKACYEEYAGFCFFVGEG